MKRLLSAVIALFSLLTVSAAENADALLATAASKLREAGSVRATCVLSGNGHTETARLTMSRGAFVIESPGLEVWFDGKTQWTYSAANDEVNVSEPTAEEIAQINPLAVTDSFRKNYTASVTASTPGTKTILLKSKSSRAEISSAKVTLSTTTHFPVAIDLTFDNGSTMTAAISGLLTGPVLPITTFRYDPKQHPGAEIIDLR